MCGIAGIFNNSSSKKVDRGVLEKMNQTLVHRGPDGEGFFIDGNVGLAHKRLSIIDLGGGQQPMFNETGKIAVVFNGEIYNYIELGETLRSLGHVFKSKSDTEVIIHAYEEYGDDFVHHLNGQFAIALWDGVKQELILVRDRVGIRPLFYSETREGDILFASEMKAILAHPRVSAELDPDGLNQLFTIWVNIPPRTVFKGISELAPGTMLTIGKDRKIREKKYWSFSYPQEGEYDERPLDYYVNEVEELLYKSIELRLRADVPVGTYLSGGLDSSYITSMVKKHHKNDLCTFSIAFDDENYDERSYQLLMAEQLKTNHKIITISHEDINRNFSDVIYYAERPMIRTAPAPLLMLSGLARENNFKVVLTGEGADEVFGGYNIFKEDKVRRFWAREPDSKIRPLLLKKLYPYLQQDAADNPYWNLFFKKNLENTSDKYYSHRLRWENTTFVKKFLGEDIRQQMSDEKLYLELDNYISDDILSWDPLCRAQYLESVLFMPGNLLCSQGDRMLMGNSVEGRFPFLDHNVIEFAAKIPPKFKIKGLDEKHILKKVAERILPDAVTSRVKRPYRAPIGPCFLKNELLTDENIENFGLLDSKRVSKLKAKAGTKRLSEREDMAMAAITSLQALSQHFLQQGDK